MDEWLGWPMEEALKRVPEGPEIRTMETRAPGRLRPEREAGTLRLVGYRDGKWIVARFLDGAPRGKEET